MHMPPIEGYCYNSGLIRDLKTSHIQIISALFNVISHTLTRRYHHPGHLKSFPPQRPVGHMQIRYATFEVVQISLCLRSDSLFPLATGTSGYTCHPINEQ